MWRNGKRTRTNQYTHRDTSSERMTDSNTHPDLKIPTMWKRVRRKKLVKQKRVLISWLFWFWKQLHDTKNSRARSQVIIPNFICHYCTLESKLWQGHEVIWISILFVCLSVCLSGWLAGWLFACMSVWVLVLWKYLFEIFCPDCDLNFLLLFSSFGRWLLSSGLVLRSLPHRSAHHRCRIDLQRYLSSNYWCTGIVCAAECQLHLATRPAG